MATRLPWFPAAEPRLQHIERNAGFVSRLFNLLMLADLGMGIFAVLLLDRGCIHRVVLTACLARDHTLGADLTYAGARRRISWYEPCVHGPAACSCSCRSEIVRSCNFSSAPVDR